LKLAEAEKEVGLEGISEEALQQMRVSETLEDYLALPIAG
jgi:hypothetical protein